MNQWTCVRNGAIINQLSDKGGIGMDFIVSNRMQGIQGSIIRELFKLMKDPNMIAFSGGNPAEETFPSADIAKIIEEVLTSNPATVLQYGLSEGYPLLRETVKKYIAKEEGIDGQEDELFIVSGGQQAADLTAKVLINEGDVVITEEPAFVGCLNTFRSYGAKLVGVAMQPDGMDMDLLEKALKENQNAKMIYTIPNFQNPTGFTTSAEKRKRIYELARQYNVVILEDNPYGALRFSDEGIRPIKAMDTDGRVVYAGSFSKVMAPAFRLGYVVFNRALLPQMTVAKQCTDVHSNLILQYVCDRYMNQYDFKGHIDENREIYRKKCTLMLDEMEKKFHPSVRFNRPSGGLFVMSFLPEGMDAFPFVEEGIKRGVACVPGVAFMVDPSKASNGFRMNYSAPTEEQIVRGVEILGKLTYEWFQK